MNAPAKIEVGIASPSYCAEMRRAHAKRIAREECQRTDDPAASVHPGPGMSANTAEAGVRQEPAR